MNKHVMFFLAAAAFALLLSGTPATAQNQGQGKGQGPFAAQFCQGFTADCRLSQPEAYGACVSIINVCTNPSGAAANVQLCCDKCLAGAALCNIDPSICAVFGCF